MPNFHFLPICAAFLCSMSAIIGQDIPITDFPLVDPELSTTPRITPSPSSRSTSNGGVFTYTPENNKDGVMADKLQHLLLSTYGQHYSSEVDFRPGVNTDADPEPTEVEIYMRSLRMSQSGSCGGTCLSWPSILIKADFILEYTNPQKTFDSNLIPSLPYIRLPRYVPNWDPELRFYNVSQLSLQSSFINLNNYYFNFTNNHELLLNSDGRLLWKIPISVVLGQPFYPSNLPNLSNVTDNVFKLQIMSNTYTSDEVKLLWKKKNPILFADNKFLNVEGMEWFQAHVLTSVCKGRNEEYGSFGVRKFGCLELSIKVTKAADPVPGPIAGARSRGVGGGPAGPVWTANFGTEN